MTTTERFIESVMEQFGFTENEARKIFKVYQKAKVVKIDRVSGQWNLTHGAFWDKDPMNRALERA